MADTPKQAQMDADWVVRGLNFRSLTTPLPECVKGMAHDTCPYNPLLGCDCGYNKPRRLRGEGTNG